MVSSREAFRLSGFGHGAAILQKEPVPSFDGGSVTSHLPKACHSIALLPVSTHPFEPLHRPVRLPCCNPNRRMMPSVVSWTLQSAAHHQAYLTRYSACDSTMAGPSRVKVVVVAPVKPPSYYAPSPTLVNFVSR